MTAVERGMEGGERFLVIHAAPRAADGPRAKADFRNLPSSATQFAIFHAGKVGGKFRNAKLVTILGRNAYDTGRAGDVPE